MENLINKVSKSPSNRRKIFFIQGESCSGKSVLSEILSQGLNAKELPGKEINKEYFFQSLYNIENLECLIIDDINLKLTPIARKNLNDILFFDNLSIEMKGYPKKDVELKYIIINSIYTIDKLFKKLPEYKERFTDIITINSQQEFFQFLAENNISIKEVFSPFRY